MVNEMRERIFQIRPDDRQVESDAKQSSVGESQACAGGFGNVVEDIGVFTSIVDSVELASLLDADFRAPKKALVELKIMPPHRADRAEAVVCTDHSCICRQRSMRLCRFGTATDKPFVGVWNGNATASIGTFNAGFWRLDVDGDGRISDMDLVVRLGDPVTCRSSAISIATAPTSSGSIRRGLWRIDTNGDRILGAGDLTFRLGDFDDVPVVGD